MALADRRSLAHVLAPICAAVLGSGSACRPRTTVPPSGDSSASGAAAHGATPAAAFAALSAASASGTSSPPSAACSVRGPAKPEPGETLFVDRDSGATLALFTGGPIDLELAAPGPNERRAAVVVHAPGAALRGFVDVGALPLRAARDLPVVGEGAFIPAGAFVTVTRGPRTGLAVAVAFSDFDAVLESGCDAVAFLGSEPTAAPPAGGEAVHLGVASAELFASPSASTPLGRVAARREGPTLFAGELRAGMRRVSYDHGLRIAGWIRANELAPGAGPDCDDCYAPALRDRDDRCPDEPDPEGSAESGCPEPDVTPATLELGSATPVFSAPSENAPRVGELGAGAKAYVFERRGAWARIHPSRMALEWPRGSGLWLRTAPAD